MQFFLISVLCICKNFAFEYVFYELYVDRRRNSVKKKAKLYE